MIDSFIEKHGRKFFIAWCIFLTNTLAFFWALLSSQEYLTICTLVLGIFGTINTADKKLGGKG